MLPSALSFFILALTLGALFQFIRGGFTSSLIQPLAPTERIWAYAFYGTSLIASGAILFFHDRTAAWFLASRAGAIANGCLGVIGIVLTEYGNALASYSGMALLALFAAGTFSMICSRFSVFSPSQSLSCTSLALFLSFPFSFISDATGVVHFVGILFIPIAAFAVGFLCKYSPVCCCSLFAAKPDLPVRFLLAIIALCVIGNFFTGVAELSDVHKASLSVYWSTFVNMVVAISVIVLLKLEKKVQHILFWCWFLFSLFFFMGVVLLTLPSPAGIQLGSDIVTTFRVALEFLLFALIAIISTREKLYASGLVGLFFLLPAGCSVALRQIAAPLVGSVGGETALGYLPTLVLLATLAMLFSWYSFANKVSFNQYFNPPEGDADKIRASALETLCNGRGLTPRECEILEFVAQGYTMRAISEKLVISLDTVRTHCRTIYRKLDVHSKQEIIDHLANFKNL